MSHFVNFSLLFFFVTLVASGLLRFFKPFDLITARVHIVFGFCVLILVGLHLFARRHYFMQMLGKSAHAQEGRRMRPWKLIGGVITAWAGILVAALWNLPPVGQLMSQSHESRNRAIIFRPEERAAAREIENGFEMRRLDEGEALLQVEILWGSAFQSPSRFTSLFNSARPQIAIWAESSSGSMIETFFVSQESAFSEGIKWSGNELGRVDILPLWRHSYTLVNGVDPRGRVDSYSEATPEHNFSVSDYLRMEAQAFTINVEVNVPDDMNDFYHSDQAEDSKGHMHPGLGQPSVLYSARITPSEGQTYYLLDFVGHGGSSSEMDGNVYYDSRHLTTARQLIERALVKVVVQP